MKDFQQIERQILSKSENLEKFEESDLLAAQMMRNDALALWERRQKQRAERTILMGAKVIAQSIAPT